MNVKSMQDSAKALAAKLSGGSESIGRKVGAALSTPTAAVIIGGACYAGGAVILTKATVATSGAVVALAAVGIIAGSIVCIDGAFRGIAHGFLARS